MLQPKDILDAVKQDYSERDQLLSVLNNDIKRIEKPSVKIAINKLKDAVSEFAVNIAISDMNGNKGFISDSAVMSVNGDTFDSAKAEEVADAIESFAISMSESKGTTPELKELSDSASQVYRKLAGEIRSQAKQFTDEDAVIRSIELDPISASIVKTLPDNLVTELGDMYNIMPSASEMKFQNGYLQGNFNNPASLPLSMLQTYYRMITIVVAPPIMTKPAIFTEELVERIQSTAEIIKSQNNVLQFVELSDSPISVDELPPQYTRSIAIMTHLEKISRESAKSWEKSTTTMVMPIEDFSNYLNRLTFMRAEQLAITQLKMDTERTIREYIMERLLKNSQPVATGDIIKSAEGITAAARPGVLPLTGIDFTGTVNGTLSENDLGKILSALDLMESGYHVTHMLVHPQAISTIFYTFQDTGLFDKNVSTNASLFKPNYGFEGMDPYALGGNMGKGRYTDPYRTPLLFGYQGAIDPKGILPRLINGINPATADINMETMLWKRFRVKVGQYEVIILPWAEAPIRSAGSDVRIQLQASPVMAVNGKCRTDILLLDARRTAVFQTTGQVAHRLIATQNYKPELAVCYSEVYSLHMKAHMQAFKIEDVLIESDRTYRVWNIRRT